ncbi:HrpA-like RNA helicase [Yasminevirus sp. GU-2018]|uniref:RNA helicase n=1 Tax=Yasminevirus sp. GU-2018 TaxID=2420051 RepID=A0A5K0U7T8_9VIRU|nr:HrpA-like RNA helicase [Yasminevirus sp. GU-2018]
MNELNKDKTKDNDNIGILDPAGENPNPLTGEPYSERYRELSKVWSKFPAYVNPRETIDKIRNNQVVLVVSGTGSGKTVLFPKFVLHALNYKHKIAITLPKQIITKSAAMFASETLDVKLGESVGYQYRGSGKGMSSEKTKLLYCTDGTLVARLANDAELKDFDAVVVDEAHERKVNIDLLLFMLREVLRKRKDFKLIIMSATINEDIFKNYYSEFSTVSLNIGTKPNYPIQSVFLEENISSTSYPEVGREIIKGLIEKYKSGLSPKQGGILFFVTSISETEDVCTVLETDGVVGRSNLCVPVFSGMDEDKQKIATDKDYYRQYTTGEGVKIIIATNVAESSLTIDGVTDVIDCGLELRSRYDPVNRVSVLEKSLITQAQAKQRMGRTGRTSAGTCYHLYTKDTFENVMAKFPSPAIKVESISYEILRLMALRSDISRLGDVRRTLNEFIEPPTKDYIDAEVQFLLKMNMISDASDDAVLTEYGHLSVELNADPCTTLALMTGYRLNCFREVLATMCVIDAIKGSVDNLFTLPGDILSDSDSGKTNRTDKEKGQLKWLTKKFTEAKTHFNNRYGDHIAILKIFGEYEKKRKDITKLKEWSYKYFLDRDTLEDAYQRYVKLKHRYRQKLDKYSSSTTKKELLSIDTKYKVMASIIFGFKMNILSVSKGKLKQINPTKKVDDIQLDKNSFIDHELKSSDKILYNQLHMFSDKNKKQADGSRDTIKAKIAMIISKKSLEIIEQL